MLFLVLLLIGYLTGELTSVNGDLTAIIDSRIERRAIYEVEDASRLVNLYLTVNNRYPQSKVELETFAENIGERLSSERLNLIYVPSVTGSIIKYERVIIFVQNNKEIISEAEFTALNTCGVGLNDDAGYCAPNKSTYTVINSDIHINNTLRILNSRINEAFYKITQSYDGRSIGFPNVKKNGASMPANSSVTLPDFVGYTGNAASCRGTFAFSKMFLNCSDLFDDFGNPVIYFYKSSKEIFLIIQTPYLNADGSAINLSRYAKV